MVIFLNKLAVKHEWIGKMHTVSPTFKWERNSFGARMTPCSCEREENEDVVHRFLDKRKDFSIDKDFKSDKYSNLMTRLINRERFLKTYPEVNNMDGFFAARLKRKFKS